MEGLTQGTYIRFRLIEDPPGAKTHRWWVETKNGKDGLGIIEWYRAGRKYTFRALEDGYLEEVCLREIAQFIVDRTAEHKAKWSRTGTAGTRGAEPVRCAHASPYGLAHMEAFMTEEERLAKQAEAKAKAEANAAKTPQERRIAAAERNLEKAKRRLERARADAPDVDDPDLEDPDDQPHPDQTLPGDLPAQQRPV